MVYSTCMFFELHFPLLVWYGQNLSYKPGYSPGYNLAYLHVIELNYLHLEWCSQFHVNSEPMDISVGWIPSLKLAVLVIVQTELKPGLIFGNRSKPKTGIYFLSIEPRTKFLVLFICEIGSDKK